MRRNRTVWLIGAPLLVLLLSAGIQRWQNTRWGSYQVGGFKNDVSGERAGLRKLAVVIAEGREHGKIRVHWEVHKPALKPTAKRRTYLWLYGIVYDQPNKRLMHYVVSPFFTNVNEVQATQYDGVSVIMIQAMAKNGEACSMFVQRGARLTQQGKALVVKVRGIVFE